MRFKPKTKTSVHGKNRFSQRYEGHESVEVMCSKALHYGIFIHQIPRDNLLYEFMENKIKYKRKKVKILESYVFVFSNTNRLITFYPIPSEYKDAYGQVRHIEDENKAKWKRRKSSLALL